MAVQVTEFFGHRWKLRWWGRCGWGGCAPRHTYSRQPRLVAILGDVVCRHARPPLLGPPLRSLAAAPPAVRSARSPPPLRPPPTDRWRARLPLASQSRRLPAGFPL